MQLLCLGDIAIGNRFANSHQWPPPGGMAIDGDNRILFNWELPIGDSINPIARISGPRLISPPRSVTALSRWSGGIATLATNHILDAGDAGLGKTISTLHKGGFMTVGAGLSNEEIARPLFWSTAEGCLGIVNWVFPETHPDWMSVPGANCWPGNQAAGHILREVRRHADWVLVILHWSDEEFSYPRPEDRRIARDIVRMGAHVLIGHHPHVVRGMEMIEKTPVFYSTGNFFFSDFSRGENDQNYEIKMAPRNREALGVKLCFTKGSHPRFQLYSFYQASNETRVDSRRRAEKRLTVCSRVLEHAQGHAYEEWYQRRWERFFKWEVKWHYGIRKRGVLGLVRYAAKRLKPNPAGGSVAR